MQVDAKNIENIIIIFNICDCGIEKKHFFIQIKTNLKLKYIMIKWDN
jgi:hypothetical protein